MTELSEQHCKPCEGGVKPLTKESAEKIIAETNHWTLNDDATKISRSFQFKNFLRTMSFVNAVAWIANQENHHPDMEVSYNECKVSYTTHAIDGLSDNDFICAAKINKWVDE